ncbi:MAG: enterochelin esterase [Armatimonadetes bacterium]|nr:enterochelin esterase [Armatimonadota bacterium]
MKSRLPFLLIIAAAASHAVEFSVTFPDGRLRVPFTGRVVVYLSAGRSEPRFGPNWFNPEPMYSAIFKDVGAGDPMVIGEKAVAFPTTLRKLKEGEYTIQAVVDLNLGGRSIGTSPGNLYSAPQRVYLKPTTGQAVKISCEKVAEDVRFQDTDMAKAARMQSKHLSAFYERPTIMRAAVILPETWKANSAKKYPVIYSIPGFGGSFLDYSASTNRVGTVRDGEEFIYVVLDPNCPTGHHVFADSANNGPWGKALTTEFIPFIEQKFRGIGKPDGRFVTGHSSGGWSSLWLQVTYPDFFNGCWSTSPDPVDFRDFQMIDIYKHDQNMFVDGKGGPRPLARFGDQPAIFVKQFSDMERPIRGEQLGSFEAVFSPRGANKQPSPLWNRDTGAINNDVALAWQKYDIGLILRKNWTVLEPKLGGKIHVYMGNMDTFYLDGAVRLLQKDMRALGAAASIELFPGDHGSVLTTELQRRIDGEMAARYKVTSGEIADCRP